MDGVDGGYADITSSPGDGTTGTLTWDGDCLPDLPEDDGPDAPVANIMARSDLEGSNPISKVCRISADYAQVPPGTSRQ